MEKPILIGIDRDGTINKDEDYFLGRYDGWEDQIEFLPGVIDGIKVLNRLPDSHSFIITNQSGVAKKYFTEGRMNEVCIKIIGKLYDQGARVEGYFACPYIDYEGSAKAWEIGDNINLKYVDQNPRDKKPNIGMLERAAQWIGSPLDQTHIFMIGDRQEDIQCGLNAGGISILVESWKTRKSNDLPRVKEIRSAFPNRVYIASDFLDAAKYIENQVKR